MFRKILVPVDFTEKNRAAIDVASEIAQKSRGTVTLLHVIETIVFLPYEESQEFYGRLEKKAQKTITALARRIQSKKIKVNKKIVLGSRAKEIVQHAADQKMDLIVLSSHKLDLQKPEQHWGTISYKVAILSQCPVLLVK